MKRDSIAQPGYLHRTARRWSLRAEELRVLAEEAYDPAVRRMMLRIASDCDWLAEKAVDRVAHDSIMFKRDVDYDPRRAALDSMAEEPKQALAR
jgi:hypothetical protein